MGPGTAKKMEGIFSILFVPHKNLHKDMLILLSKMYKILSNNSETINTYPT